MRVAKEQTERAMPWMVLLAHCTSYYYFGLACAHRCTAPIVQYIFETLLVVGGGAL